MSKRRSVNWKVRWFRLELGFEVRKILLPLNSHRLRTSAAHMPAPAASVPAFSGTCYSFRRSCKVQRNTIRSRSAWWAVERGNCESSRRIGFSYTMIDLRKNQREKRFRISRRETGGSHSISSNLWAPHEASSKIVWGPGRERRWSAILSDFRCRSMDSLNSIWQIHAARWPSYSPIWMTSIVRGKTWLSSNSLNSLQILRTHPRWT